MPIVIPDHVIRKSALKEEEFRLELAIYLFEKRFLTLGQASELADLSQYAFQQELGKRDLFIHYDLKDLEEDLDTLKSLRS